MRLMFGLSKFLRYRNRGDGFFNIVRGGRSADRSRGKSVPRFRGIIFNGSVVGLTPSCHSRPVGHGIRGSGPKGPACPKEKPSKAGYEADVRRNIPHPQGSPSSARTWATRYRCRTKMMRQKVSFLIGAAFVRTTPGGNGARRRGLT